MTSFHAPAIASPLVLVAIVVAGFVLWLRFRRIEKSGGCLAVAGWLILFAVYLFAVLLPLA